MSDEIVEEAHRDSERHAQRLPNPHLLAYDFFKHMTSLSVLTLGGVLTLAGSIFADPEYHRGMFVSAMLTAGAGFTAYVGLIEMVESAQRGKPPRLIARLARGVVPALFGGAVGAFLSTAYGAFS